MPADEPTSDDRAAMAVTVAGIARDHLDVDSFDASDPDFELFHSILTEDLHRALEAAYLAGRWSGFAEGGSRADLVPDRHLEDVASDAALYQSSQRGRQ